jgi:uncharacterized surface protein with fasciclin (FAS1) repeats
MSDILETAAKAGNFSKLLEAVELTELEEILKGSDSYTLFAPVDEAFSQLSEEVRDSLFENKGKLKRIIAYHIGFGDIRKEDLLQTDEVTTMEGSIIGVDRADGQIKLNDAKAIDSDILADNGVIHAIDRVLIPALVMSE